MGPNLEAFKLEEAVARRGTQQKMYTAVRLENLE